MDKSECLKDLETIPVFAEMSKDTAWRALSQRKNSTNKLVHHLWTEELFRAWSAFYRTANSGNRNPDCGEYRLFVSMGLDAAGWKDISHGAMLMMVLDEAMQELVQTEMEGPSLTRELTTNFEKPLRLPAAIMARAWAKEKPIPGSRKLWVFGSIEDSAGVVYATGRAVFIKIKPQI